MLKENEGKSKKKSTFKTSAVSAKSAKSVKKTAPSKKPHSVQSKKKAGTGKMVREMIVQLEQNLLHTGHEHKKKSSIKLKKSKEHSHSHSKSKKSTHSSKKSMEFFEVEVTHAAPVQHHKNITSKYPLSKMTSCAVGKSKSATSNKSKKSRKSVSKTSPKKSGKGKKTA